MKVLVIQPKIGMGDMVIYLPYIHAISKKYQKPISILVKENSRANQLLLDDKHIDEIIILDRTKDNSGSHDGLSGFFKLSKEIKSKNFDKVFIFNSSLRYLLISKIAKIKNISQYPLFRKKDNIVTSAKIFTENELNAIVSTEPKLNINQDRIDNAKQNFSNEYKHVCLGISASGPTKRWDINNFIKLCSKINNKIPTKFYLAAGNNDKDLINQLIKSEIGSNCVSFENLKISEAMPIIKNCNLYIGNDTGWLHIASALGLKCLALFMDSPVQAYGKYSKNINVIVPEGQTEQTTTHDTLGADKISFEKVFNKSIELLN
ncbi:MAG: glycosyltransferase family 9 protein [Candidatus Pelagibacter sp.]|jgi:heptosyltransferase-2|nr:glycosyltransferase family 9 protein [Candidatus Pelagibacter sp.]|tara:strand:+ start:137 stop:1093 length:957 start_codon:yes stop_codon:yes gene_type:complete